MAAEETSTSESPPRVPSLEPKPERLMHRLTAFETVLVLGGLALFLVLLYEMHQAPVEGQFLSPPLIAAAGVILLWPLRKHRAVRAILLSGGFLLALWFIDRLSGVLLPFAIVYLLAYLFDPAVTWARERWRLPRWASSLIVVALVIGLVAFFVLMLVPQIVGQVETLATLLLGAATDLRQWLASTTAFDQLESVGIDKDALTADAVRRIQVFLTDFAEGIPNRVQGAAGSLFKVITMTAIVPVVLYYTLKDYPHITRRLVELFPTFGGQRDYLVKASGIVGNYLRGQLTISAISAVNVSTVLLIFDVPFALLIGLLSGVLNLIPSLGAIITNIIGVIIALTFGGIVPALIVFLTLLGQSLLEQSLLTPKILSSQVGLHPVLILLALFTFGYFLGIFGFFIAVPVTALVMTYYKTYRDDLTLDLHPSEHPSLRERLQRLRHRSTTRAAEAGGTSNE